MSTRAATGATAGIAERIADRLAEHGAQILLRQVGEIETVKGCDVVVFGAPVYDQSRPPEADAFVTAHREALAARPLWLFSVDSFGDTKQLIGPLTHNEPRGISQIRADLRPVGYRVSKGVIRKQQWPFWSGLFFHAFGGRFGDHRDWQTIDAWATRIAAASTSPESPMSEQRH